MHVLGIRDDDDERAELTAHGIASTTVGEIRGPGAGKAAEAVVRQLESAATEGFWVHLDADVPDPSVMPAVDSPDPDGLLPAELAPLLRALVQSERCVGFNLTVYDPDGSGAVLLADLVESASARG